MKSATAANRIRGRFRTFVRHGNIDAFLDFARSDQFGHLLIAAGPNSRIGLLRSCLTSLEKVKRRARVVEPLRQGASRTRWSADLRDRLRLLYSQGLSDAAVGRRLQVSTDAVRLARRAFLGFASEAPRKAVGGDL